MNLPEWWKHDKPYAIMDCLEGMRALPDKCVDLTVTSPPYDNLRDYGGYVFDFENIAKELFRITKDGGVVVWVVGDATIEGSETGSSFRQALYFKEIGLNLHDTMIYEKKNPLPLKTNRYQQCFEYMFILSKKYVRTFHPIKEKCKGNGENSFGSQISKDGSRETKNTKSGNRFKIKKNIFSYNVGSGKTNHPAVFPDKLCRDQINSWTNRGDIVLDPFLGSGTTLKMARHTERLGLGFELNPEYEPIIRKRMMEEIPALERWF